MFICSFAVFHVEENEEYSVWKSTDWNKLFVYELRQNLKPTMKIKLIHNNESQWASQVVRVVKNLRANTGDGRDRDACSIPGSKKIPWNWKRQLIPLFLPGKSMNIGFRWVTVHGFAKSQTWLSTHAWTIKTPKILLCLFKSFGLSWSFAFNIIAESFFRDYKNSSLFSCYKYYMHISSKKKKCKLKNLWIQDWKILDL